MSRLLPARAIGAFDNGGCYAEVLTTAIGPEALARLKPIFDDVWKELISEGVFELPSFDEGSTRTRLAYKVLTFASTDWTEIQMRQLLLRAFRNEVARLQRAKSLGPRAAII